MVYFQRMKNCNFDFHALNIHHEKLVKHLLPNENIQEEHQSCGRTQQKEKHVARTFRAKLFVQKINLRRQEDDAHPVDLIVMP